LHYSNFITLKDLSDNQIFKIFEMVSIFKKQKNSRNLLLGKNVALLFEKPSTRTRISFELGAKQLGANTLYLDWNQLQLGRGESLEDTARVLGCYVDCLVVRVNFHNQIEEFTKHAKIPIINALSDKFHPTQVLSDLYTILEKKNKLKGIKLAYIGDGNNICNSLLLGCSKVGINLCIATPEEYKPDEKIINWALENANLNDSIVDLTDEPLDAVKDADIIYTDVFVSMGSEEEKDKRLNSFLPKYQVTKRLLKKASRSVIFMHPLPANRGQEVVNEVIDGDASIVWEQAKNKLDVAKAVLNFLLQ
jgi:ornithine carbamoyltransferase